MRNLVVTALLFGLVPANAASAQAPASTALVRTGQMLRDPANLRIGSVDSVKADGSVGVIVNGRYVVVPASTLSVADGKLTTSLTKKMILSAN